MSDTNFSSTAEEIIQDALANMTGNKKHSSTGIMICCPFHEDSSPSFGINLNATSGIPLGKGHCLGCGKTAHWNEIADKLGFPKLKKGDFKVTSYKQKERQHLLMKSMSLKDIIVKDFRCSELVSRWPADRIWRSIGGDLMNKFAYRAFSLERMQEFAILPVMIDGELCGAIKAVVKKTGVDGELSYVTSKASDRNSWVKKHGLFPYDVVQEMLKETGLKTVVLCEGPRDSLKLISREIPALSILGSKTWSVQKMKLVLGLPIDRVILMMDGDRAGREATAEILPTLTKRIDTVIYNLSAIAKKLELKKLDPCMVAGKIKYVKQIKELII